MFPVSLDRLARGFGANLLGKLWVVLAQLACVPALTHAWGAERFGVWLLLSTIPTYVALTDLGLGSSAAVELAKDIKAGALDRATSSFQTGLLFLGFITLLLAGGFSVTFLFWQTLSISRSLVLNNELALTVSILLVYAIVAIHMGLIHAVYRGTGRYALGTILLDLISPVETLVLLAVALRGGGFVAAASGMLVARGVGLAGYYICIRRHERWLRLGIRHASWNTFRKLIHPSLASLSLTASSALAIQGVLLVVGAFFGPTAAGLFAVARTVSRIPLQLVGLGTRASVPELTLAYFDRNPATFRRLGRINMAFALAIAVPAAIIVAIAGPWMVRILSHASLTPTSSLLLAMSAGMLAQTIWTAMGAPLNAINLQHRYAHYYLLLSGAALALVVMLRPVLNLEGVAAISAASEITMIGATYLAWLRSHRGISRHFADASQHLS
jgi:O-antigen/teichoic acid export membrane protein